MSTILFLAFGMPAAPEWIVISIVALILLGPKKLPDLAKGIGRALGEIQRAREDFHREFTGLPPLPKIETPRGVSEAHAGDAEGSPSKPDEGDPLKGTDPIPPPQEKHP